MNTKAGKLRGKLGSFAKEREEFELKKKELEEEMFREKQNMGKIRKGLRGNDLNLHPSNEEEEENMNGKRLKGNTRSTKISTSDSTEQLLKAPPIPSGPKISDWCYVGPIDSSPPVIKSQELYEDVRFLGRGAYGTVDLVKNREDNKLYASKTLLLQHKSDEKGFFHEIKFLRQHRHPFIVHLHDVFMSTHPRKVFLIMHYCESGDLGKVISLAAKNNQPLSEAQVLKWISQVALALSYLHGCNIAHRDIKPVNILLSDNGEVAQLSDFGLATEVNFSDEKEFDNKAEVGTPYYTAPEMINNEHCTLATDCWSLGVCFFELLALRLPFDGDTTVALVRSILQDQPDLALIPSNFYSSDIFLPLEGLLNKDPNSRMTANQFLLTQPITSRVAQLPNQYRPKYLEERLRRYHAKQMTNQLEKLGITSSTPQQQQTKSLYTPGDKGVLRLNPLGEGEEDDKDARSIATSSAGTSRCTTRERNLIGKSDQQQQHLPPSRGPDLQLSVDVEENHEEEVIKLSLDTGTAGTAAAADHHQTDLSHHSHPKDGVKSPILPSLSSTLSNSSKGGGDFHIHAPHNHLPPSSNSRYGGSLTASSTTTSLLSVSSIGLSSQSEMNTPISINMKSIRMISTTGSEKSDGFLTSFYSSSGGGGGGDDVILSKHGTIGPIESASNYLKKHLQNQQLQEQQELLMLQQQQQHGQGQGQGQYDDNDDYDNLASLSSNGIHCNNGKEMITSSSGPSSSSSSGVKISPRVSPRTILTTITPSTAAAAAATASRPSSSSSTSSPPHVISTSISSSAIIRGLAPTATGAGVGRAKSPDASLTSPVLHPPTTLPPLLLKPHDSTGASATGVGTSGGSGGFIGESHSAAARPSSTDSCGTNTSASLKSGRREKRTKSERSPSVVASLPIESSGASSVGSSPRSQPSLLIQQQQPQSQPEPQQQPQSLSQPEPQQQPQSQPEPQQQPQLELELRQPPHGMLQEMAMTSSEVVMTSTTNGNLLVDQQQEQQQEGENRRSLSDLMNTIQDVPAATDPSFSSSAMPMETER